MIIDETNAAAIKTFNDINDVLREVRSERYAQDAQWGTQDHPMLPAQGMEWIYVDNYRHDAEQWKVTNGYRNENGALAWDGILLEEVYEALSETDPAKREAELVQVAAVAVAAVQSSRRARGLA
ncbi:hypothetical protein [Micromonospora sp. CB01531]|uniref:hypothetical protein n=1 Tax=Micromonospora sp. CB01531 TaxID=1718947 RepID=UPI00095BB064|nr:hypothetical protein [Micromonospora sp. CB01531]OKI45132.1 hypothetical protein A6A27_12015 [Micromonospora sp. CB01531]